MTPGYFNLFEHFTVQKLTRTFCPMSLECLTPSINLTATAKKEEDGVTEIRVNIHTLLYSRRRRRNPFICRYY